MSVAVSARSADQVEAVAREIDGLAVVADVCGTEDVDAMVAEVEREFGPIDLLVNNAGIGLGPAAVGAGSGGVVARLRGQRARRLSLLPRGAARHGRARSRPHREHGQRRLVPSKRGRHGIRGSKAALDRFGEPRRPDGRHGIAVFVFSPGLVHTDMTEPFGDDLPGRRPSSRRGSSASSRAGAPTLAGRYIHAEHDDIEDLIGRADEVVEGDLNAIRLQR